MLCSEEFPIIGTGICISERGQHGHEGAGVYVSDSAGWTVVLLEA